VEGGLADSGVTDDDAPPAEDADRPPEETPIDCL
jgi:hypothetical protein